MYFLGTALGRSNYSPNYNEATESFLKSSYLSDEIKKNIISVLDGTCSEQLLEVLNSEKQINDFSKDDIKEIKDNLYKAYGTITDDSKKKTCANIYDLFDNYIFVLDGDGPKQYTIEIEGKDLPITILEKSGIPSIPSYYSGYGVDRRYLNEKHLFSIYKKYIKYYPDKADEYVKMVNSISKLTATEFVTNYLSFVNNGLDSSFKQKEGNISLDGVYGETRNLVGAISIFSVLRKDQDDMDKKFEIDTQMYIRKTFAQMIEDFKNSQTLEQEQTSEAEKKLDKRFKQD